MRTTGGCQVPLEGPASLQERVCIPLPNLVLQLKDELKSLLSANPANPKSYDAVAYDAVSNLILELSAKQFFQSALDLRHPLFLVVVDVGGKRNIIIDTFLDVVRNWFIVPQSSFKLVETIVKEANRRTDEIAGSPIPYCRDLGLLFKVAEFCSLRGSGEALSTCCCSIRILI